MIHVIIATWPGDTEAPHSNCNLNYKDSYCIPVIFHNLSDYDAHFIKDIATAYKGRTELLPMTKNKEKYVSFTKYIDSTKNDKKKICIKLRFIDSFKFFTSSLGKLASYLDKDKLKTTRSEFFNLNAENFDLLMRKGIFPYEYIDCVKKLKDTCLPPWIVL